MPSRRTIRATQGSSVSTVRLLSGDNPQIAKGMGDGPVQEYIAAIPGWKQAVARQIDRLIVKAIPMVRKGVKWNSPFYGVGEEGWFLSFHCFNNYIKVVFFRGTSLKPMPPGTSKQEEVRYLDVKEKMPFDETQFMDWVRQAASLPPVKM